jgi:hypothetical protein
MPRIELRLPDLLAFSAKQLSQPPPLADRYEIMTGLRSIGIDLGLDRQILQHPVGGDAARQRFDGGFAMWRFNWTEIAALRSRLAQGMSSSSISFSIAVSKTMGMVRVAWSKYGRLVPEVARRTSGASATNSSGIFEIARHNPRPSDNQSALCQCSAQNLS